MREVIAKWIELLLRAHNERHQEFLATLTCAANCCWVSMPLSNLLNFKNIISLPCLIPSIVHDHAYAPSTLIFVPSLTPCRGCNFFNPCLSFLCLFFSVLSWRFSKSFRLLANALRASSLGRETFLESFKLMPPYTSTGFVTQTFPSLPEAVLPKLIAPVIALKDWKDDLSSVA